MYVSHVHHVKRAAYRCFPRIPQASVQSDSLGVRGELEFRSDTRQTDQPVPQCCTAMLQRVGWFAGCRGNIIRHEATDDLDFEERVGREAKLSEPAMQATLSGQIDRYTNTPSMRMKNETPSIDVTM